MCALLESCSKLTQLEREVFFFFSLLLRIVFDYVLLVIQFSLLCMKSYHGD